MTSPLTLKEICCALAHTRVDVGLRGLDVVMEVIAEGLDVRDDLGHSLRSKMPREEN